MENRKSSGCIDLSIASSSTPSDLSKTQPPTQNNSKDTDTYFLTGSVEKVLAWSRVLKHNAYFEVIGSVVSIQQNSQKNANIFLLKDKKGPILQVIQYVNQQTSEEEFSTGDTIRCAGYFTGINSMIAVSLRRAEEDEAASLQRFCHVGDFTLSGFVSSHS